MVEAGLDNPVNESRRPIFPCAVPDRVILDIVELGIPRTLPSSLLLVLVGSEDGL